MCLNRNLKVSGFLRVFESKNTVFECNMLVINMLSQQKKSSKKLPPVHFFEDSEKFCIYLIYNSLYSS